MQGPLPTLTIKNGLAALDAPRSTYLAGNFSVAVGTNAVPVLVEALRLHDSAFKRGYQRLWPNLPIIVQRYVSRPINVGLVKSNAVYLLGVLADEDTMLDVLKGHFDSDARSAAAMGLWRNTAERVTRTLIQALDDKDGNVREAAIYSLSLTARKEASPELFAGLYHRCLQSRDPQVRIFGLALVEQLPAEYPKAMPELRKALTDDDSSVRRAAAEVLGQRNGENMPPLMQRLVISNKF